MRSFCAACVRENGPTELPWTLIFYRIVFTLRQLLSPYPPYSHCESSPLSSAYPHVPTTRSATGQGPRIRAPALARVHIDMGSFGSKWLFAIALSVLAFLTASATAQVSTVAAALNGVVTDSSGAVLPDAVVTIRNVETGQVRQLATNGLGEFWAAELSVGTYEVSAARDGFAAYRHSEITLLMGKAVRLEIVMQPESVKDVVTVTNQPDALEPTETALITNVETERIEELPVQSRNYLNFVLLSPGVSNSQTSHQTSGGQVGLGLADSGFSFGGLRGCSNSISIDGLDNNDEFTGAGRTELSLETIREFQVVNTGISAESGGSAGGAINVITKSGTNLLHGDAFLFVQNAASNARDPLSDAGQHPDFNRYRSGFSIGGPIRKNRTFYYVALEQEHTRGQEASDIDAASIVTINSVLASEAYPALPTRTLSNGLFSNARAETELSGKLDHQLMNNQNVMLRYAFTNNREAGDGFNRTSLVDFSDSRLRPERSCSERMIQSDRESRFPASPTSDDLTAETATVMSTIMRSRIPHPTRVGCT